jgi:hypothetical protein
MNDISIIILNIKPKKVPKEIKVDAKTDLYRIK